LVGWATFYQKVSYIHIEAYNSDITSAREYMTEYMIMASTVKVLLKSQWRLSVSSHTVAILIRFYTRKVS